MRKKKRRWRRYYFSLIPSYRSFPNNNFFLRDKEDETIRENLVGKKINEVLSRRMTRLALTKVYFKSSVLLSILYLIGLLPLPL